MKNEFEIKEDHAVVKVYGYGEYHDILVSLEDFDLVSDIPNKWYLKDTKGKRYAYYQPYINNGKRTSVMMHQVITDMVRKTCPKNAVVDHINGDTFDNRRDNLQVITQQANVRKANVRNDNPTGHKHIQWIESRKRYRVEFNRDGTYKFIGRYKTLEEAILARDTYLKE